jgi:hypothetical protein
MVVKTTEYFERRIRERGIERGWCEAAVAEPIATEIQAEDRRVRYWWFVAAVKKYLRVITEADGTFVNAFFDRTFERRRRR